MTRIVPGQVYLGVASQEGPRYFLVLQVGAKATLARCDKNGMNRGRPIMADLKQLQNDRLYIRVRASHGPNLTRVAPNPSSV